MLYHVMDPKAYINEGFRLASATYGAMDRARKEIRTEEPPPHSAWGALENTAGGAIFGSKVAGLLGEAGLKLPALLGGGEEVAPMASAGSVTAVSTTLGLNPWGALIGAGIGLLGYLFS